MFMPTFRLSFGYTVPWSDDNREEVTRKAAIKTLAYRERGGGQQTGTFRSLSVQ